MGVHKKQRKICGCMEYSTNTAKVSDCVFQEQILVTRPPAARKARGTRANALARRDMDLT